MIYTFLCTFAFGLSNSFQDILEKERSVMLISKSGTQEIQDYSEGKA